MDFFAGVILDTAEESRRKRESLVLGVINSLPVLYSLIADADGSFPRRYL